MLGYMSKKEAIKNSFTHHGSYYGIPMWIAQNDEFMIATKWEFMDPLFTAATYIEGFLQSIFYPNCGSGFMFKVGQKIED